MSVVRRGYPRADIEELPAGWATVVSIPATPPTATGPSLPSACSSATKRHFPFTQAAAASCRAVAHGNPNDCKRGIRQYQAIYPAEDRSIEMLRTDLGRPPSLTAAR